LFSERDAVPLEQRPIFFLKRSGSMMFYLIPHIRFRFVAEDGADGEHAVATLPKECLVFAGLRT
jgi:hypothetical protein